MKWQLIDQAFYTYKTLWYETYRIGKLNCQITKNIQKVIQALHKLVNVESKKIILRNLKYTNCYQFSQLSFQYKHKSSAACQQFFLAHQPTVSNDCATWQNSLMKAGSKGKFYRLSRIRLFCFAFLSFRSRACSSFSFPFFSAGAEQDLEVRRGGSACRSLRRLIWSVIVGTRI